MSSPPPYQDNPDKRALPAGWITQFDPNYKTWFYVNTEAKPPTTTWVHPLGPPSSPPPERRYSPPPVPPVNSSSAYTSGPVDQRYIQGNERGYGGGNNYPDQQSYGDYGDGYGGRRNDNNRGLGGLLGRLTHSGNGGLSGGGLDGGRFGGELGGGRLGGGGGYPAYQQQPQVVYAERPPQVVYVEQQQQPPRRSGGLGTGAGLALGAGGGLLGGLLLADVLEDHDRDNGDYNYDNNYDGGDDGGFF